MVCPCISVRVSVLGNSDKFLSVLPPPPHPLLPTKIFELRHCLTWTLSEFGLLSELPPTHTHSDIVQL